jgi:Bifunctional DNA primase/polymerase, N-terminal
MTSTTELNTRNEWAEFWRYKIGANTVPANTKLKGVKGQENKVFKTLWKRFQNSPLTEAEFQKQLDNHEYDNGIAVMAGKTWHNPERVDERLIEIDIDNLRGKEEFLTDEDGKVRSVEEAAKKWMIEQHETAPNRLHLYFRAPRGIPNKAPDEVLGIEVKAEGEHGVTFCANSPHPNGDQYEIIGTNEPELLTEKETIALMQHIDQICRKHGVTYLDHRSILTDQLREIGRTLKIPGRPKPKINEGVRHPTMISFCNTVFFNNLNDTNELELRNFCLGVNNEICKPPLPDSEIADIINDTLDFVHRRRIKEAAQATVKLESETSGEDAKQADELTGLDSSIREQLTPHIYKVISFNPLIMYVAHQQQNVIIKVNVNFKKGDKHVFTPELQKTKQVTANQFLQWKTIFIEARPLKVKINESPIEETIKYQVTFIDKLNKAFTIGPCSITAMIEELNNRGLVIKKQEAVDALVKIIRRYQDLGLAEVTNTVLTQGYYIINGKFEAIDIRQNIETQPDVNRCIECADFLDALSIKHKNLDIFPTHIKWWLLAPFGYILKGLNRWLKWQHSYAWSSSSKTTDGVIGLAMWRLDGEKDLNTYQLKLSSIDSIARFGNVISRTTYPIMVNEVGGLREKTYNWLVELIKGAVESTSVRGKFIDGKYQVLPSLSNIYFTSNPNPPLDSGYRSRFTIMHYSKDEVHDRESDEAKEFKRWIDTEKHKLAVLGDFIAWYVITKPAKPEDSILLFNKDPDDIAKDIIAAFYTYAGKDRPEWLDRTYKQRSILEENEERAYFEIRSFLLDRINNAYNRYRFMENTPANDYQTVDLDIPKIKEGFHYRFNFCMANRLLPFLHELKRRKTDELEIAITIDILTELERQFGHIEGITTLVDLGREIPGFTYDTRWIGGKTHRVIVGLRKDFVTYTNSALEDKADENRNLT